jgi:hypothetical protein
LLFLLFPRVYIFCLVFKYAFPCFVVLIVLEPTGDGKSCEDGRSTCRALLLHIDETSFHSAATLYDAMPVFKLLAFHQ